MLSWYKHVTLKVNSNCSQHNRRHIIIIIIVLYYNIYELYTHPAAILGIVPVVLVLSNCFHGIRQLKLETGKIYIMFRLKSKLGPGERGTKITRVAHAAAEFAWHAVFAELIGKLAKWFCWSDANSFTRVGSRANNNAITTVPAFVDWTGRLYNCIASLLSNNITIYYYYRDVLVAMYNII